MRVKILAWEPLMAMELTNLTDIHPFRVRRANYTTLTVQISTHFESGELTKPPYSTDIHPFRVR